MDDCSVINNSSSGTLSLSKSSLLHNAGGDAGISSICNDGTADIVETTFDNNYGVVCGAIFHRRGELTLTQSSITKSSNDGASSNICLRGGHATVAESTIAHNQGGLGVRGDASVTVRDTTIVHNFDTLSGIHVACCGADVTVENSTISHNRSDDVGGGIANDGDGEVVLKDTILANNDALEDGPDCFGAVRVSGSTLIGDPSGCTVRGDQQCSDSGLLPIAGVTASGFQPDREPENTLDDDLGTRWSSHGRGEWIQFDLGSRRSINEVLLAWFRGDRRRARFRIQVSNDAREWRLDRSEVSSGTTLELERYVFPAQTARYLRILANGNTDNDWNGITEARIVGCRN